MKLTMLIHLTTVSRSADLSLLDTKCMVYQETRWHCLLEELTEELTKEKPKK